MLFEVIKVFKTFFWLGCSSFGGPIAHVAYFQRTFVFEKQWLQDSVFARLLALCQFLPGPSSSQLGFAIGYQRAGFAGGIAAFIGFTLPSFLIMSFLALLSLKFVEVNVDGMGEFISGVTHGLKLLAVTVVADAVIGMYGRFCNQAFTRAICFLSTIILLVWSGLVTQIGVIVGAALIGWLFTNSRWLNSSHLGDKLSTDSISVKAKFKLVPIVFFVSLLVVLPLLSVLNPVLEITNSFYQAGSWVFGGGHVMLPLLQEFMLGKLTHDQFLSGYAAAQAVPGPMFTLSTYLGIISLPDNIILGAVLATLAIFLPGFLLLVGVQSRWLYLSESRTLNASITCINASVVGLLASALYQPVFTSAVESNLDMAMAITGFYFLHYYKVSVIWLVFFFALVGGWLL